MEQKDDFASEKYLDQIWQKFQESATNLNKVNIMIAGKSGVGKSTLINKTFRDDLAQTGIGKPTTDKINIIEKEGIPIRIYDTVGLELDFLRLTKTKLDIQRLVRKTKRTPQIDDDIHCLWYCVGATGMRFEDAEANFVANMAKQGIPVILVLTKAGDKIQAEKLLNDIWSRSAVSFVNSVILLAENYAGVEAYGIDQLIEKTYHVIPKKMQGSLVNAQKASLKLKRKKATQKITLFVATTFGEGFIPVSLADSAMMIPTQLEMLKEIADVYGVEIEKHTLESIIPALLGVFGAFSGGKALASYLKAIPGFGIATGLISGGVGSVITTALGATYIQLMELILAGKINLEDTTSQELKDVLIKLLKSYLSNKMPGLS